MEKILSVSVAAYNVEAFLENTLQSFVVDPEHRELLEVLVVDDGSKDRTERIARAFEEKYPETFRVIHKENGGYGSTINTSSLMASGKYFKLVDGDDWVDSEELCRLIDFLGTCDADAVLTKYCAVEDGSGARRVVDEGFCFDGQVHTPDVFFGHFLPMHFLAVKTSLLRENGIRITEKCFYTDLEFVVKLLPYIRNVALLDAVVYMYRVGRAEQSVSILSWQKNIDQAIRVNRELCRFYGETEVADPGMRSYIRGKIVESSMNIYRIFLSFPASGGIRERIPAYDKELAGACGEIHGCCRRKPLICLLMLPGLPLYRLLSFVYRCHLKRQGLLA